MAGLCKLRTGSIGRGRCALTAALVATGCVDRDDGHLAGSELYVQYCAACPGDAGKGDGPLAVWGAHFEDELEGEPLHTYVGLLQTRSLVDYLRTIQAKP